MLMRRQYARAARAADQTRACVSAAHRPTRLIEMTRGGEKEELVKMPSKRAVPTKHG